MLPISDTLKLRELIKSEKTEKIMELLKNWIDKSTYKCEYCGKDRYTNATEIEGWNSPCIGTNEKPSYKLRFHD